MSAMRPSCDQEKCVTGVFRSFINSIDHRPSYLIHTKIIPVLSHDANFWYGSFHFTSVTYMHLSQTINFSNPLDKLQINKTQTYINHEDMKK